MVHNDLTTAQKKRRTKQEHIDEVLKEVALNGYSKNANLSQRDFVELARAIPYIKNTMTIQAVKDWYDKKCDYQSIHGEEAARFQKKMTLRGREL